MGFAGEKFTRRRTCRTCVGKIFHFENYKTLRKLQSFVYSEVAVFFP